MVNVDYLNEDQTGALQEWASLTLHLVLVSLLYVCMNACLRSLIYFESQMGASDDYFDAHIEALKKERAEKAMDSLLKFKYSGDAHTFKGASDLHPQRTLDEENFGKEIQG